jgi:hypothetical protein
LPKNEMINKVVKIILFFLFLIIFWRYFW